MGTSFLTQNKLHEIVGKIEFFSCLFVMHAFFYCVFLHHCILHPISAWYYLFKAALELMYCSYKLNMLAQQNVFHTLCINQAKNYIVLYFELNEFGSNAYHKSHGLRMQTMQHMRDKNWQSVHASLSCVFPMHNERQTRQQKKHQNT